jgi:hypothetical protein
MLEFSDWIKVYAIVQLIILLTFPIIWLVVKIIEEWA